MTSWYSNSEQIVPVHDYDTIKITINRGDKPSMHYPEYHDDDCTCWDCSWDSK